MILNSNSFQTAGLQTTSPCRERWDSTTCGPGGVYSEPPVRAQVTSIALSSQTHAYPISFHYIYTWKLNVGQLNHLSNPCWLVCLCSRLSVVFRWWRIPSITWVQIISSGRCASWSLMVRDVSFYSSIYIYILHTHRKLKLHFCTY